MECSLWMLFAQRRDCGRQATFTSAFIIYGRRVVEKEKSPFRLVGSAAFGMLVCFSIFGSANRFMEMYVLASRTCISLSIAQGATATFEPKVVIMMVEMRLPSASRE